MEICLEGGFSESRFSIFIKTKNWISLFFSATDFNLDFRIPAGILFFSRSYEPRMSFYDDEKSVFGPDALLSLF